jgi:hypothetical protein
MTLPPMRLMLCSEEMDEIMTCKGRRMGKYFDVPEIYIFRLLPRC